MYEGCLKDFQEKIVQGFEQLFSRQRQNYDKLDSLGAKILDFQEQVAEMKLSQTVLVAQVGDLQAHKIQEERFCQDDVFSIML